MYLDYEKFMLVCARKCLSVRSVLQKARVSLLMAQHIKDGRKVNTRTAGKLAAALGVDVTELLPDNWPGMESANSTKTKKG